MSMVCGVIADVENDGGPKGKTSVSVKEFNDSTCETQFTLC